MDLKLDPGERLDPREIARYSRHLTLPDVGMEGQLRLRSAGVLLVGAGGLGSPLALYLAAAGVGRIGIVEFDAVDASNLQRQLLYGTADVGQPKAPLAKARIGEINPHVDVETHELRLSRDNALQILSGYDVIVDGTDNFPTRYLVNDACVLLGKPNVYGSIFRFEGQASIFWSPDGPCYRCLYPEPPEPGSVPNCAEGGVLGVLPGIIGTVQATEAIKLILGKGEPLVGRLLLFDALEMRFRELKLRKDPACPICGEQPKIRELVDYEAVCGVSTEANASAGHDIRAEALSALLQREGHGPVLLDVRNQEEFAICRIEGARLIPAHELPARIGELNPDDDIVVYCHVGVRSARAASFLRERGYRRVRNLAGGIDAWARQIDPALPRY